MNFCHKECPWVIAAGNIIVLCQQPEREVEGVYLGTSCEEGKPGITVREMIRKEKEDDRQPQEEGKEIRIL